MANIILGTVQFGLDYGINNPSGKLPEEKIAEILAVAYTSGIHTLDTAAIYGDAIEHIGSFHRSTGAHFDINTKFIGLTIPAIEAELEDNLVKLGIKTVETYFYHTFSKYKASPHLAKGLNKMKTAKLIRSVGLSVYTNNEFEVAINDPDIDVIQLPFNLLDNYFQRHIYLQRAREKQKRIQARSVFLQGLFFMDADNLPVKLYPLKPYLQELKSIALQYNLSMESLCLQYVNSRLEIDDIIIGIDNKQQLMNNLASIGTSLPAELGKLVDLIRVKETELLYPYNW
ncbi:MAG: uncharacterized protein JWM28_2439 [Chitinophagaceae bacterium]|nr:uncharacterized protein [Chitinophagaceae bacterium]